MRLESQEPKNESEFFHRVRDLTASEIHWERVEPSNESGFPDTHFCLREGGGEGTLELKYERASRKLLLSRLMRGSQKSALIEYYAAGGRRRWALCYWQRNAYLYDTESYYRAIVTGGEINLPEWSSCLSMDSELLFADWLRDELRWRN